MEGNFLSRYENKVDHWTTLMKDDPENKKKYQSEMSDYIISCMPYMNLYSDTTEDEINTDNVFNVKETVGLKRKDIFNEYLIEVEKQNLARPIEYNRIDECPTCSYSNVIHIQDTSELVCDACGLILATIISEELTYKEYIF